MVEHVALAGKIVGFRRQERGIRVEGLMPVHLDISFLIEEAERLHRPAGAVLAPFLVEVVERVVIGPALVPVGA